MADLDGVPDGNSDQYKEAVSGQKSTEIISSRSNRSEVEYRSGDNNPAQQAETPLGTVAQQRRARSRPARLTRHWFCAASVPMDRSKSCRTRASRKLAPYLNGWRTKVERLGTLNFPQYARNAPDRQPGVGKFR